MSKNKKPKVETLALDLLRRHCWPPTPANYRIAYDYVTGTDPKVVKIINEYEANGMRLDTVARRKLGVGAIDTNDAPKIMLKMVTAITEHLAKEQASNAAMAQSVNASNDQAQSGTLDVAAMLGNLVGMIEEQRQFVEASHDKITDLTVQLKEAQEMNGRDPLTGISNRRVIDAHIAALSKEKSGHGIAMIDIDHFKKINDTYGHGMGDRVIQRTAEIPAEEFDDCLVGRYGGEEFLVAFSIDNGDFSLGRLESFRRRLEREKWQVRQTDEPLEKVTVSIGYARRALNDATTGEQLVQAADAKLYQAKQAGRNRILTVTEAIGSDYVSQAMAA